MVSTAVFATTWSALASAGNAKMNQQWTMVTTGRAA
jgi:hypothetical protein